MPTAEDTVDMMKVLAEITAPQATYRVFNSAEEEEEEDGKNNTRIVDIGDKEREGSKVQQHPYPLLHAGSVLGELPSLNKKPVEIEDRKKKSKKKKEKGETTTTDVPVNIPKEFLCSLTRRPMSDPVKSIYGNTFERSAITSWFSNQGRICPLTGEARCFL